MVLFLVFQEHSISFLESVSSIGKLAERAI